MGCFPTTIDCVASLSTRRATNRLSSKPRETSGTRNLDRIHCIVHPISSNFLIRVANGYQVDVSIYGRTDIKAMDGK
jgi:hypothetical protein